jgi:hypothetical protein
LLPEPYKVRIGGQKENYADGETVNLVLYLRNNPRCEAGQWVNREMTLNTLSFSVEVERIISPPIPPIHESIVTETVQGTSVGPVAIPSGTEIEVGQWTWRQTDSQGNQVGEGRYGITFRLLDPSLENSAGILVYITVESKFSTTTAWHVPVLAECKSAYRRDDLSST